MMADLGETSGKLEGWMLTLPGYDSEDLDDETLLHHFDVELNERRRTTAPCARCGKTAPARSTPAAPSACSPRCPKTPAGHYCLIASTERAQTLAMAADAVVARNPLTEAAGRLHDDGLLSLSVGRLPARLLADTADQPGAAAWRSVSGMRLDLTSGERFRADLEVGATTAARGRQMKQLLGGLSAVMQMMASGDGSPEAAEAAGILSDLSLTDRADGGPGLEIGNWTSRSRVGTVGGPRADAGDG